MKKFIVGLLGIFLLFGASLFTACGKTNPSLTLSQDRVAIQLYAQDEDSSYKVVTAEISGVNDGSISASANSGYESTIKVSTSKLSSTKSAITIEGLREGQAEIIVRATPGNLTKRIYVTVYSEVSEMTQKQEDVTFKNNFLLRGEDNYLDENKLIEFKPSNLSRRNITWSLYEDFVDERGLQIDGTILSISDDFVGNEIKLVATTEKDVSTIITLPVLDKIEGEIGLSFSYSQNSSFDAIDENNNEFNIVPNIPEDDKYTGYILVDYIGDLDITPYVLTKDGAISDDIQVLRHDSFEGKPLFIVYASKDKSNINNDYVVGFKIGYANYNYFIDTMEKFPITIKAREMVNGIILSSSDNNNVANSVQTLYTNYVEANDTQTNGQKFDVTITPTTVIDVTNKYSIVLSRESLGGQVADGCPIEIYYKNAETWVQVEMILDPNTGNYYTASDNLPSAKTLYMKASNTLKDQSVDGYKLTFTSEDNPNATTSFSLRLVKSSTISEFTFNDADFKVDSSNVSTVYTKRLTLNGQTSIDGLYIVNNSNNVVFNDITEVSYDDKSVTFDVSFMLKASSYGVTAIDNYQIAHKNGLISDRYTLDIFLPLKYSAMYVDTTDNQSNSVISSALNNKVYSNGGLSLANSQLSSLSKLILKNNATTPIIYSFNSVAGISAVANISVNFFDFNEKESSLEAFKALIDSEEGTVAIVRNAQERGDSSNIAYFTADKNSIITKGIGHTYAVVAFTGKGVGENADQNGNVTFVRIIYIESLVVPENINVYPNSDRNVGLYSMDTVATSDEALTRKTISIKFAKSGITYDKLSNLQFVTSKSVMGRQNINDEGNTITWANGRYSIENISISDDGITFNIVSISTFGDNIFTDTLNVHYFIEDDNGNKLYDIYTPIEITIRNAQRIESLKWKNFDEDGLYFEVGNSNPQYLLFETSPTNAKNNSLSYIIEGEQSFVSVSDNVSSDTLAINLSNQIRNGMSGFVYFLPADAIYNNQIRYYYMDGEQEISASISDESLHSMYDFLMTSAYFKSNVSGGEIRNVNFSEVLVKIKITVADGKSFNYAYRIYDNNSFLTLNPENYYTVMNDLDLSSENRRAISIFNGGLQGYNSEITIKFNGDSFADIIGSNAEVRNITFIGNVIANGFVANENRGTLTNVTIDTDGIRASVLTGVTQNIGGLVGSNETGAKIINCNVLGLSIMGGDRALGETFVGGFAGLNEGLIENSHVEFYNLEKEIKELENGQREIIYASNKFIGQFVGGFVGRVTSTSVINKSYVYDYTLSNDEKYEGVLQAVNNIGSGNIGAFIGSPTYNTIGMSKIDYSFAVTNANLPYINYQDDNSNVLITNSYFSCYNAGEYYSNSTLQTSNVNFAKRGDDGFNDYVNNGLPHLKDFMQGRAVESVANYRVKTLSKNGFYKSLAVDSTNGVLFNYQIKDLVNELTTNEENDLRSYNTISIAELLGDDPVLYNIIVTSSNSSIVKVVGRSLQVLRNGEVVLTIASKQDVSNSKQIRVKVVYALSEMIISWSDKAGRVSFIQDNSVVALQKTQSRVYSTSFNNAQLFLGALATPYQIEQDRNMSLDIVSSADNENKVQVSDVSGSGFRVISESNSVRTSFDVCPKVFADETYQEAIKLEFNRHFTINPIDGVISFDISEDGLPITPSTNSTLEVKISTTDSEDSVYPVISLNGYELSTVGDDSNVYKYYLSDKEIPIFTATVNKLGDGITNGNGLNTYTYLITFEVYSQYRPLVSEDLEFDVYMMSNSGNSSLDWNGQLKLSLTKQGFTNIDVSNRKITGSVYKQEGSNSLVEVHEAGQETPVLAPGNSSVLQINVNPEYAYYDYVELSYSNATISEAINMEVLSPFGNSEGAIVDKFTRREINGDDIENISSNLRFYPRPDEKGTLYFKLWVNSSVNRDSVIKMTARFYEAGGKEITFVNYYLTISYLAEPVITIDGANTAYVAKGAVSTIKIEVLADQSIDNLTLEGSEMKDISLSSPSRPVIDNTRGIKTYTATLYVSPLGSATDDIVYIQAQVSRELNGSKEIKNTIATAVIVDFKVDKDNISINDSSDGQVTIWQGVPKPLTVGYNIIPEEYLTATNEKLENAISELRQKRDIFLGAQFYPANVTIGENGERVYTPLDNKDSSTEKLSDYKYFINYKYNDNKELEVQTLEDRLYFSVGNQLYPISSDDIEKPFDYVYNNKDNSISLVGSKVSSSVSMVLKTYISAGGVTQEIETYFSVTVEAYSDPDLPLLIKNAKQFKDLAPSSEGENVAHDYILTNDILLENYSSFDTTKINSLDGNGYTIHIKSFDTSGNSTLNLALFNNITENTILKNVRVNLYNGGQINVDVSRHSEVNIAGFAINNEGIITNCEVVSYYTSANAVGDIEVPGFNMPATTKHNKPEGINVTYTLGANDQAQYITDSSSWSTQIAGFVLTNVGSITNSRVGGDSIIVLGSERLSNNQATGYTYASTVQLGAFNIIGQGNMAGFVLSNSSGNISACYAKYLDMENQSDTTRYYVSGFVGSNTSNINVSYVEAVPTEVSNDSTYSAFAYEGSSLKSKKGYIVGFVYNNEGKITDSYSNILISNSQDSNNVYRASGFVNENTGIIENGYSASQIKNAMNTQMNFSGVDEKGNPRIEGTYINCYFFNKAYEDSEENTDNSMETQYKTGAILIPSPDEESLFYGFAVANGENDGIWKVEEDKGIFLVSTNFVSISHRYIHYVDDENFGGVTGEDDQGKYILPYATLTFTDKTLEIDTALGGAYNPIIISDAQEFIEVTGTSQSSYIKEYYNSSVIWGTYRLVDDINLSDIATGDNVTVLPSSTKAFGGTLYGNGFTISGLSVTSEEEAVAIGLFKSIERRGRGDNPIIKNLNVKVKQVDGGNVVAMAGALAGYVKDAVIVSVSIEFDEGALVTGLNFAGGLAGFVIGDNTIKCITITNPNVRANTYLRDNISADNYFISDENRSEKSLQALRTSVSNNLNYNTTFESSLIKSLENYSYAGGMLGFVDIYKVNNNLFDINQSSNFSIKNVRVNGVVYVEGQVAGGVFGLSGYQTSIRDIGLTINGGSNSHIIATKYFAGGIVGQSFGSFNRIFSVYDDQTQKQIEDGISLYYNGNNSVPRGNLDIFYAKGTQYSQRYIGGLVGYAQSGNIEVSYSKLNVTSPTANYAGGIIGGLDLVNASSYQVSNDSLTEYYSSYYINEVYATGDVRSKAVDVEDKEAQSFAGGIIGQIRGLAPRVALKSVNAFNYITTYNYQTEQYEALAADSGNLSAHLRVNSIVGDIIRVDQQGNETKVAIKEQSDYAAYLNLIQYLDMSDGTTTKSIPSVGIYEGYFKNRNSAGVVTLNLFGEIAGKITNDFVCREYVYAIESPTSYSTSSVGHQYTNTGFIGSGAWNVANWEHDMNELFPTIKYRRTSNILYLDCYNIDTVFRQMSSSNATVYIRGRESEGSEVYKDIDLISYYKDHENNAVYIQEFAGRLRGGVYYSGPNEPVKIISDRNFINSVAPGFNAVNVEVTYKKGNANDKIGLNSLNNTSNIGLFINKEVADSTISGLTINIENELEFQEANRGEESYVGLIAPKITNSDLSNITINSNISNSLMTLIDNNSNNKGSTLYAGLLAGEALQSSTIRQMLVENITLNLAGDIITVGSRNYDNAYVGSYFGAVNKSRQLGFNIELNNLVRANNTGTVNTGSQKITFSDGSATDINVGGYIGAVGNKNGSTGLDGLNILKAISTEISLVVGSGVDELNAGGIIGNIESAGISFNLNGTQSTIDANVFVNEVNIINAGGIVGLQKSSFTIQDYSAIEFGVINNTNTNTSRLKSNKESLEGNYDTNNDRYIQVSNSAYIGGVVGQSKASLSVTNQSGTLAINKRNTDKNVVNSFRVSGGNNVYMGSVLGYSTANELNISVNELISQSEFYVNNGVNADVVVGGIVGKLDDGSESTLEHNYKISNNEGGNRYVQFDGAVYSNSPKLTFGGIVGEAGLKSGATLKIKNASFGGVAKIYGTNSNSAEVITGGTIGNVSNVGTIQVNNNRNYGDVFVEYGSGVNALSKYTFGGLIGNLSSGAEYKITENYSITTTHNARNATTNNYVNALFGNGTPNTFNSNYYNHAVVLANDDNGTDLPYKRNQDGYLGYDSNAEFNMTNNNSILSNFSNIIVGGEKGKINPELAQANMPNTSSFNGIKYYYLGDSMLAPFTFKYKDGNEEIKEIKNFALIGDGKTFDYNATGFLESSPSALVDELKDFSFISGMVINANIVYENINININIEEGNVDNGKVVAPLVREMTGNSIVYAINTKGTLSVGGSSNKIIVSGLVGAFNSGKIFDCSTDIDIIYRGGSQGAVYGITELTNNTDDNIGSRTIENTYSSGSITSYISANIYAFANGIANSTIRNCYAIPKLDLNDYTNENNTFSGKVEVFGAGSSYTSCYFDYDALNYYSSVINNLPDGVNSLTLSNFENVPKDETDPNPSGKFDEMAGKWTCNDAFNYGYPTLKYQYLKPSSYAYRSSTNTKYARLNGAGRSNTEDYDNYIVENEYTRLPNGVSPIGGKFGSKDTYYMIINPAILAKKLYKNSSTDDENNESGKYILKYDIDLTKIVADKTNYANVVNKTIFKGIFDGQDKTIKGLEKTLFSSVTGTEGEKDAIVRNLRLTDVEFANPNPVLAKTISYALISNITLGGNISPTNSTNTSEIGGLANTATNSVINTTTSTLNINFKCNNTINVGGIVGKLDGSEILFCSNYGPLNVIITASKKEINLGGLVGEMSGNSEIKYSYNATSVLGNYASGPSKSTTSTTSTTTGTFRTGGLVGYLTGGTISNSYNSGMIKSGNKSNYSASYAGGIVGYGEGGSINSCYNEGTVEALGKDPEHEWRWLEGDGYEKEKDTHSVLKSYIYGEIKTDYQLVLKQVSNRNVYAYGIGYCAKNDTKIENSSLRLYQAKLNNDEDRTTIYSNGASLGNDDIIFELGLDQILNTQYLKKYINEYAVRYTINRYFWTIGILPIWNHNWTLNGFEFFTKFLQPVPGKIKEVGLTTADSKLAKEEENAQTTEIQVISVDSLNIPRDFIIKFNSTLEINYYRKEIIDMEGGRYYNSGKRPPTIHQLYGDDIVNSNSLAHSVNSGGAAVSQGYKGTVEAYTYYAKTYSEDISKISNKAQGTLYYTDNIEIKKSCRSKENGNEFNTLKIAGNEYYLADRNNMTEIFSAGIYTKSFDDIEFSGLPYVNNKDLYTIKVDGGSNNVLASITEIYQKDNKTYVSYSLSSTSEINGNYTVTVSIYDSQTINISLENLQYYFNDYYSISMEIDNIDYKILDNYKLSYKLKNNTNVEKGNVIRISSIKYDENNKEPKEDEAGAENFIYLSFDETTNRFIYIPNAKLTTSRGKVIEVVNRSDYELKEIGDDYTESDFYSNVQNIINNLSNKVFYSRTVGQGSSYVAMNNNSFTDYSYNSNKEYIAGEERDVDTTLEYGQVLNNVLGSATYDSDSKSYKIDLPSSLAQNTIALKDGIAVLRYKRVGNDWKLGINEITVNGTSYNVSIQNNAIYINTNSSSNSLRNAINNYFGGFTFIINNLPTTTLQSAYSNIATNVTYELFGIGNRNKNGSIIFTREIYKNWSYNDVEIGQGEVNIGVFTLSKTGDGISLRINNTASGLTSYSLPGDDVVINYGSASINLKESYTSKITNANIRNNMADIIDYKITLKSSDNNISFINESGITPSRDHNLPITTNIMNGKFDVDLVLYSTYEMGSTDLNETNDYKLLLKDNNDSIYYLDTSFKFADNENKGTSIVNSISRVYSNSKGESILLKLEYSSAVSVLKQDNVLKDVFNKYYKYSLVFSESDIAVLSIIETYDYDNLSEQISEKPFKTQYIAYYDEEKKLTRNEVLPATDENGNYITDEDGDYVMVERETDGAYVDNVGLAYLPSIGSEQKGEKLINYVGSIDNLIKPEDFEDILKVRSKNENGLTNFFLYVDGPYTVINEVEKEFINMNTTLYSSINVDEIVYEEFDMPTYNSVQASLAYSGMKFDEILDSLQSKYYVNDRTITFYLRGDNETDFSFSALLQGKGSHETTKIEVNDAMEIKDIILTKDLSFINNIDRRVDCYNIIGNGYNISYYGNAFFKNVSPKSAGTKLGTGYFISHVNFLGESYGGTRNSESSLSNTFLMSCQKDSKLIPIKLQSVNLYGSIVNSIGEDGMIVKGKSIYNDVNSYISINNVQKVLSSSVPHPISLFDEAESYEKINNYGVIVTANGIDFDSSDYINGTNLQVFTGVNDTNNDVINQGLIVLGKGGNGAGGTCYNKKYTSGDLRSGQDAGSSGSVKGFAKDNNNVIYALSSSKAGRAGFIQRKTLQSYVGDMSNENDTEDFRIKTYTNTRAADWDLSESEKQVIQIRLDDAGNFKVIEFDKPSRSSMNFSNDKIEQLCAYFAIRNNRAEGALNRAFRWDTNT